MMIYFSKLQLKNQLYDNYQDIKKVFEPFVKGGNGGYINNKYYNLRERSYNYGYDYDTYDMRIYQKVQKLNLNFD